MKCCTAEGEIPSSLMNPVELMLKCIPAELFWVILIKAGLLIQIAFFLWPVLQCSALVVYGVQTLSKVVCVHDNLMPSVQFVSSMSCFFMPFLICFDWFVDIKLKKTTTLMGFFLLG